MRIKFPRLSRGLRKARHLSSPMLAAGGIVSGVFAVVSAMKAAPEATRIFESLPDEATVMDKVKAYAPVYGEAITFTGLSIILGGASIFITGKQLAAMGAAAFAAEQKYREYKDQLFEDLDNMEYSHKEVDESIRRRIAERHAADKEYPTPEENEHLFFDDNSKRWFTDTLLHVHDTEYHFNRNYALRGWAALNEFYELLNHEEMPPITHGDEVGWDEYYGETTGGYHWIDFEHDERTLPDGTNYILIMTPFEPTMEAILGDGWTTG